MIQPLVFEIFSIKKTRFWKKSNKFDFFEKESTYLERRKNTADLCFCFGYLNQSCVRIGSCDGADGEFPGLALVFSERGSTTVLVLMTV